MKKVYFFTLAFISMQFQFCEKTPDYEKIPVVIVPAEPGKWRQMLDTSNIEMIQTAFFSIGNRGFTINPQTNEVFEYNATDNKIIRKKSFPGPRRLSMATAFAIGGNGYYGLGLGQKNLKEGSQTQWGYVYRVDLWKYDPMNDEWTRKSDCPIPPNVYQYDPKQSSFFGAYGIVINNKAYIGSGRDINFSIRRYLYEYEPQADKWRAIVKDSADIYPPGHSNIVMAFAVANKGYIGNTDTLWEFDPAAVLKWRQVRSVTGSTRQPVLSLGSSTKGYVFGSLTSLNNIQPQMVKDFYEFTPDVNGGSWRTITEFKGPARAGCPGFILNNRIYIGFGSNIAAKVLTDIWEYMPVP